MCVLLMGMLFCTAGCAATEQNPSANHTKATDLPPLVTDTSEEITDAEPEETVSVTETTPPRHCIKQKLPHGKCRRSWEHSRLFAFMRTMSTCSGAQNDLQQTESVLYHAKADTEPEFAPLYANANASAFVGLTDFDVLSDGTICGLICENTDAVPYEDPTFNPDEFDWESYYENYATQYQLVWYDKNGVVCKKLGLSTLLDLDETSRQTMAFTGVRCDASDHVYLTATIDESECLMALDDNGNLCPVQGNADNVLSLESDYQWVRCSDDGMLLWECDTDDVQHLSHIVVTDGALWKTQTAVPERMTADAMLAESEEDSLLYGIWNEHGLYCMAGKNTQPELLYQWDDCRLTASEIAGVMILPQQQAIVTVYTAQGNLTVEFLMPEAQEEETSGTDTTPPVATPVNFS
ncbi:MAG: hypothetical protein ACLUOF_08130 [Ruminococcus sp.]